MKGSVLFVDDESATETLMRQVFRRELRKDDFHLAFARDGRHALEVFQANGPFDVVITDINMPGLDGFTLLSRLQELDGNARTVMASAYFDSVNVQKAKDSGADHVLNKPIDITALRGLLREWLQAE